MSKIYSVQELARRELALRESHQAAMLGLPTGPQGDEPPPSLSSTMSRSKILQEAVDQAELDRVDLYVRVEQARNLKAADLNGKSDPYAVITVGKAKSKTKTVKKTLDPKWGEVYNFDMDRNMAARYIEVEVYDYDWGPSSADDFLGYISIPLVSLQPGKRQGKWYRLGLRNSKDRSRTIKGHLGEIFIAVETYSNIHYSATSMMQRVRKINELHMPLGTLADGSEIIMPPRETETVEDVAFHVMLRCAADRAIAYCDGVLILTNYRVIFVSNSRLAVPSVGDSSDRQLGDLTTQIPIGNVTSVDLETETSNVSSDGTAKVLRVQTFGGKELIFLFSSSWEGLYQGGAQEYDSPVAAEERGRALSNPEAVKPKEFLKFRQDAKSSIERVPSMVRRNFNRSSMMFPWTQALNASTGDEDPPEIRLHKRLTWHLVNPWALNEFSLEVHRGMITELQAKSASAHQSSSAAEEKTGSGEYGEQVGDLHQMPPSPPSETPEEERSNHPTSETAAASGGDHHLVTTGTGRQPFHEAMQHGWRLFDLDKELKRMGLNNESSWRICNVNQNFEVSATYPRQFVVPTCISDDEVSDAATFRSKGRLPVMVWHHTESKVVMCRCAQPLAGLGGKRNAGDEKLVEAIATAAASEIEFDDRLPIEYSDAASTRARSVTQQGSRSSWLPRRLGSRLASGDESQTKQILVVVDCRPYLSAAGNMFMGKGTESKVAYPNIQVEYLDIPNIHTMRASVDAMEDVCLSSADTTRSQAHGDFVTRLHEVGWLSHIRQVLAAALYVTDLMWCRNLSVLVHCSDGWDRTSQITSLAQLFMDPYYRTISGFLILIEKEWLCYGHKFEERCGRHEKGDKERSPIFRQFIECVALVLHQKPEAFQFNETFLLVLLEHLTSGWFGTFWGDNVKKRLEAGVSRSSLSLWTLIDANRGKFLQPEGAYQPNLYSVIFPVVSPRHTRLWSKLW